LLLEGPIQLESVSRFGGLAVINNTRARVGLANLFAGTGSARQRTAPHQHLQLAAFRGTQTFPSATSRRHPAGASQQARIRDAAEFTFHAKPALLV